MRWKQKAPFTFYSLTEHFTILEPQNPLIKWFYVVQKRRSTGFECGFKIVEFYVVGCIRNKRIRAGIEGVLTTSFLSSVIWIKNMKKKCVGQLRVNIYIYIYILGGGCKKFHWIILSGGVDIFLSMDQQQHFWHLFSSKLFPAGFLAVWQGGGVFLCFSSVFINHDFSTKFSWQNFLWRDF